jgi:hypothetical protein
VYERSATPRAGHKHEASVMTKVRKVERETEVVEEEPVVVEKEKVIYREKPVIVEKEKPTIIIHDNG